MNILTFDIEEWYHFDVKSTEDKWLNYEPRIELYLPQVLDLLDLHGLKATFFCLGWIARIYPNIIKEIYKRGHEIACHSDKHFFVKDMTPSSFEKDLQVALASLEDIIGEKVKSFRAPSFTITESELWAFEILANQGIENDCSIFPATRSYGGFPLFGNGVPSLIEYNGIKLKEFPMNTMKIFNKDVVYSGGGYFRLFPYQLIKNKIKNSKYVMTYLHMRDFDYEQPKFSYFTIERTFKSYFGLKGAFPKFKKLISDFNWINVAEAAEEINWEKVKKINLNDLTK